MPARRTAHHSEVNGASTKIGDSGAVFVKKFLEGWRGYPPRSARWRPARADRETVGRKSDLEAAEIPSPGAARGPDLAPSEQEPGPWQQAFPAAWYELVCPKCGLVDDCVGIPHD